jgi:hypothetical protein
MVMILAGDQVLSPQQVCPGCVLADPSGQPRWRNGALTCCPQYSIAPPCQTHSLGSNADNHPCPSVECAMGFRIVQVRSDDYYHQDDRVD